MLARGPRRHGTYTIISGGLDEDDMVVVIDGDNFLVVLRPEPGLLCEVFGYLPGSEVPDSEPAGEWDSRLERVGLWDDYGAVAAWYSEGGSPTLLDEDLYDPHEQQMDRYGVQHRSLRLSPRADPASVRPARRAAPLSTDVHLDDPIPDPEPALFTVTPHTNDTSECYDLVFPVGNLGGAEMEGYVVSTPQPLNLNGITWGVHKRSGRVYVHAVDESLLPTQAIPELATSHSRPSMIEGCYLLAVNRKPARLMTPEMVEARMHGAESDDTRRGGLELTFQSQPKASRQDRYLNPRLTFAGTIWSDTHAGVPVQLRRAGIALDVAICAATQPQARAGTTYSVTEDVFLALRRRRLLHPPPPSTDYPLAQQDYQERWARSLRELRKDRGLVEFADRRDKFSHKSRDHDLHFHGSKSPGFLQCGSRRGPAETGKTVAYRRKYAARHLKGRAFHAWERKTLYSMRVKRYCRHAEFRTKRHCFDYWLDVTLDWMKKASGGRRELPPEEIRRRQQAAQLPPDTVRRLREGAATQVPQGLSVWEYRLLSFYFDKLRRLHSDELCRWMNSFRMRRVIEAWYTYAASIPARQTASGGIFGRVGVPKRAVGALRELRSSRPTDSWNETPDPLRELRPYQESVSSRWNSSRDTSVMRIHRAHARRERTQSRRIEAAHLTFLSCGSADAGGSTPSYSYHRQLRLGD